MADASHAADDAANDLPPVNDPTHDVPGGQLALWLGGSIVSVFVIVWLLGHVYDFFLEAQRDREDQAPNQLRATLTEKEQNYLGAGQERRSVDEALEDYLSK